MTRWCHCPLVSAGKLIIRCFSTFREPLLLLGFLVHLQCHHPKTKTKSNRHTHTQKKKEQCKSNYTVCTRTRESSPPFTAVQTHNLPCSSRLCSRFFAAKSYCGSCVVDWSIHFFFWSVFPLWHSLITHTYLMRTALLDGNVQISKRLFPEPTEHKWTILSFLESIVLSTEFPSCLCESSLGCLKTSSTPFPKMGLFKQIHMATLKPLSERGSLPWKGSWTANNWNGEGKWVRPWKWSTSVSS